MRTITKTKQVKLKTSVHEQCLKDKDHYQKTYGGGKWSISDTIEKYQRIIEEFQNGNR